MKKAIYGENADLSDDDIINSNSDNARATGNMVKGLSNYLEFPESEQGNIRKLKDRT